MRAIGEMDIIQIDVTNACVHECSNCTRFCGHHRKPFFMDFTTFQKAVDSLRDFPGIVGVMGGEPTLHPEFERFSDYLRESRMGGKRLSHSRQPILDMVRHIYENLVNPGNLCGLWSCLNAGYYKHFETISDTYGYQILNDHGNTCKHQGLLIARKELGIPDNEWFPLRDRCWVQNNWSASITPKGAFFCEVAAALDMLFQGEGGWDITDPDWWKKTPAEFGRQLDWCELCGAAIDTPVRLSADGRDDVTPGMRDRLLKVGSPKAGAGKVVVLEPQTYKEGLYKGFHGGNEYMESSMYQRTSSRNRAIYPREFVICREPDKLGEFLLVNHPSDWVICTTRPDAVQTLAGRLESVILNPGCLYKYGNDTVFSIISRSIRGLISDEKNLPNMTQGDLEARYPKDKIVRLSRHFDVPRVSLASRIKWRLQRIAGLLFRHHGK